MDFSIADGRAPVVTITTPTTQRHALRPQRRRWRLAERPATTSASCRSPGPTTAAAPDRPRAPSTWSVASVPLSQGANVITVTARDAENNISTDRLTVTRTDGQPPTIEITLPTTAASHRTTETTIAIGGTAADEFGVTEVRWSSSRGAVGRRQRHDQLGRAGGGAAGRVQRHHRHRARRGRQLGDGHDHHRRRGRRRSDRDDRWTDGGGHLLDDVGDRDAQRHGQRRIRRRRGDLGQQPWRHPGRPPAPPDGRSASIALQLGENVITVTARTRPGRRPPTR